jgi:hypothetical protein
MKRERIDLFLVSKEPNKRKRIATSSRMCSRRQRVLALPQLTKGLDIPDKKVYESKTACSSSNQNAFGTLKYTKREKDCCSFS